MVINRRKFLAAAGTGVALSLAGCGGPDMPDDAVTEMASPVQGDPSASVAIELYEDFSCPHCKTFNDSIHSKIVSNLTSQGKAKLVFRDYPLPTSSWSWPIAMAARSVQDRGGDDAFWRFWQVMYDNQNQYDWGLVEQAATKLNLDGAGVVADAKANKYRPVVQADKDHGQDVGVKGTPSVFVAGELVAPPEGGTYNDYYSAIAQAVQESR